MDAEKMLTDVGAGLDTVLLILSVHRFIHPINQQPLFVFFQQRVPGTAPEHFNDIPAGAPEYGFQLLYDFSVTPNRTIQTLQVAINDKNQIVQVLLSSYSDRPQRLRFIHFPIAHHHPYPPPMRAPCQAAAAAPP